MTTSACKACGDNLVIVPEVVDDEEISAPVPDDLLLPCGCHFHWQCLMDESAVIVLSLKCPGCNSILIQNQAGPSITNAFLASPSGARVIAQYVNEGGVQNNLDILPSITEEAYLMNNPSARPARAFQVMCSEGDVEGIVDLLTTLSNGQEHEIDAQFILQYQDPLADMKTGLHLAIEMVQADVVWLLLWLCSTIPDDTFPVAVRRAVESGGVGRLHVGRNGDIRSLKTVSGATSRDLALKEEEQWQTLLKDGLLSP